MVGWVRHQSFTVGDWSAAEEEHRQKNGALLPDSIRGIIVGPSNCGKTNVLMTLLTHPDGVHFEHVCVFSKTLFQPKYKLLHEILRGVEGVTYTAFGESGDIPPPEKAKPNTVFIFDDVTVEDQDQIRRYFCFGHHVGVDVFYLSQTYSRIPKQLVRDNANLIIAFKQDKVNLKHVYEAHVGADMSFNEFLKICDDCWNHTQYSFLVIDKTRKLNDGRYRRNLQEFYTKISQECAGNHSLTHIQKEAECSHNTATHEITREIKIHECSRLEELPEGSELTVKVMQKIVFRKKNRYLLEIENQPSIYLSNYWMEKELEGVDVDLSYHIKIKLGGIKTTPNKHKERTVFRV